MNEPSRDKLLKLYDQLRSAYGSQAWWPAETPFEVIVGAILVQSTAWRNVVKAIDNLRRANLLTPSRLGKIPQPELEELVRPSGYFRVKAKKLRAFLTHLEVHHNYRLDSLFAADAFTLREELLSIYGIGNETADSIVLYAAEKPVFVIDSYTHRLLSRLGWVRGKYDYDKLQAIFMDALPHDVRLFNEFHALIDRHSSRICRKTPRCEGCVLLAECPFEGKEAGK
ncbi:MAG: endonuclease III domain-containing protein [Candidatus Poribacteria bacterium]|nr:endonuclease III domain-containing protein [Candidatus Poribacteria bacterium]